MAIRYAAGHSEFSRAADRLITIPVEFLRVVVRISLWDGDWHSFRQSPAVDGLYRRYRFAERMKNPASRSGRGGVKNARL